jgi:hypothetical protein
LDIYILASKDHPSLSQLGARELKAGIHGEVGLLLIALAEGPLGCLRVGSNSNMMQK